MAQSNDLTSLPIKENLFTSFQLTADSYRDIALPDLINRNLDRDCARTTDFFSFETRPYGTYCRAYQAESYPSPSSHFSSFSATRFTFLIAPSPDVVVLFLTFISFSFPSPTSSVLSSFVFNAQANVIVTSWRPCAKRAHGHRLTYRVIRLILSRAM